MSNVEVLVDSIFNNGNPFISIIVLVVNIVYNRFKSYYPIVPLAVLLVYFIYRSTGAPFSDFAGYYFGSAGLLQGDFKTVYDTYALNALIAQKGYTGVYVSYTPFPPFTSVVFAPFLLLPVAASKIMFNFFSAGLLLFTIIRVHRFTASPRWLLWLIPVIFFIPLRNNIFFGQSYLLVCVLLLEGFMAWKKGKLMLSSTLWATAIVFKLFPAVILFYLIAKKQYKQVVYVSIACALLGSISLLLNGMASWQYYVFTILPRAFNGELNDSYTYVFQSACMLLKNFFVYDEVQNTQVVYNSNVVFSICMALFKALILACCVGATIFQKNKDAISAKKPSELLIFSVWITASLLLSPNGSSYSLILLLIPFMALSAMVTEAANNRMLPVYLSLAVLFLIATIPVQAFGGLPLLLQFPRLYLLLLFFFLLLYYTNTRLPWKLLIVFFAVLLLPDVIRKRQNDTSTYLLAEKAPLIYEYAVKNNRLVYYYWDDKGKHEADAAYAVQQYSASDVQLQNNQLFYKGKQITSSTDLKKQPMIINGRDIVYLSDKNRGVGFYALRKIHVQNK